jgi:SAM-dependent methyltransferase
MMKHPDIRMGEDAYAREREWHQGLPWTVTPAETAQSLWDIGSIIRLCGCAKGATVLDLGCGPGWTSWFLRECGYRVISADLSLQMLVMSRARDHQAPPAVPVAANGEQLPFRANEFDAVVVYDALHHMPDVPAVVRECRRVLKPGGTITIGEPGLIHYLSPSARAITRRTGVLEKGFARIQLQWILLGAGFRAVRHHHRGAVTGTRLLSFLSLIAGFMLEPLLPRRKLWLAASKPTGRERPAP